MIDILSKLAGPAREIAPGQYVRDIAPTPEFWDLWRNNKEAVKAEGVKVKPGQGRDWIVVWTCAMTAAEVASSVVAEATEATFTSNSGGGTTVNYVANFVPVPLPDVPWSTEQLAIFEYARTGTGNRIIKARAGTGKTTTSKVFFTQAPELDMLYAVFGKRNEMEARGKITDPRVTIKTLHALGFMFIQRVWVGSKLDNNVEMDRLISVVGPNLPNEVSSAILKLVAFAKNAFIDPTVEGIVGLAEQHQVECEAFEDPQDGGFTVAKISAIALKVVNAARVRDPRKRISFNDMVWLPVAMNWVRPTFDLVLVDEAQDMNVPQLEMARRACKQGGRMVIVGDDRQAIFAFRGAVSDGLEMMRQKLNAEVMGLTVTYRCPKLVVYMAQEYVPDYKAAPEAPNGIVEQIASDDIIKHAVIGNAILSRANAPLMPICLALLRKGISARIEGRDVGKMLLAMIKKLKAKSVPDFIRKVTVQTERQLERAKARKASDSAITAIEDTGETLIALAEDAKSVSAIEERCTSLFANSDDAGVKPAVVLSSTHKAKGLEWDKVFIIRDTYLRPGRVTQEEKNIFYVAITRTKHTLVFVGGEKKEDKANEVAV